MFINVYSIEHNNRYKAIDNHMLILVCKHRDQDKTDITIDISLR